MITELGKRGLVPCAFVTLGLSAAISGAQAHAAPRPFSDFLQAQGTYCLDFDGLPGCDLVFPPELNIIHWTGVPPDYKLEAIVDYAGLYNNFLIANGKSSLGTTVSGQVNERALSNGTAEVQVNLQTKNALTYAIEVPLNDPIVPIYGAKLVDVFAGAKPALSTCSTQFVFINSAPGAPLPDIEQVAFFPTDDQFMKSFGISCTGQGALASGGKVGFVMRQTVTLFRTPFRGANADAAPVELIALHPLAGNSEFDFREVPQR